MSPYLLAKALQEAGIAARLAAIIFECTPPCPLRFRQLALEVLIGGLLPQLGPCIYDEAVGDIESGSASLVTVIRHLYASNNTTNSMTKSNADIFQSKISLWMVTLLRTVRNAQSAQVVQEWMRDPFPTPRRSNRLLSAVYDALPVGAVGADALGRTLDARMTVQLKKCCPQAGENALLATLFEQIKSDDVSTAKAAIENVKSLLHCFGKTFAMLIKDSGYAHDLTAACKTYGANLSRRGTVAQLLMVAQGDSLQWLKAGVVDRFIDARATGRLALDDLSTMRELVREGGTPFVESVRARLREPERPSLLSPSRPHMLSDAVHFRARTCAVGREVCRYRRDPREEPRGRPAKRAHQTREGAREGVQARVVHRGP